MPGALPLAHTRRCCNAGRVTGPARPVWTQGGRARAGPGARTGPRQPRAAMATQHPCYPPAVCRRTGRSALVCGSGGGLSPQGQVFVHISEKPDNRQAAPWGSPQPPVWLPLCPWPFVLATTCGRTNSEEGAQSAKTSRVWLRLPQDQHPPLKLTRGRGRQAGAAAPAGRSRRKPTWV